MPYGYTFLDVTRTTYGSWYCRIRKDQIVGPVVGGWGPTPGKAFDDAINWAIPFKAVYRRRETP